MANLSEAEATKSEKYQSPVPPEKPSVHVYPDWSAMEAYYGPGVAIPPYYNSGNAPHAYIWNPQHMMLPYGAPYAAVFSHRGILCHSAVPLATIRTGGETLTGNAERNSEKKSKAGDGLAVSTGNANDASECVADTKKLSQSSETDTSSGSIDDNTTPVRTRARFCDADGMSTELELKNSSSANAKSLNPCLPSDACVENEKELKREKRKQSNRESARRSRLRKRAETEELGRKVESLTAENVALRTQINLLQEKAHILRLENTALAGKVNGREANAEKKEGISTENLLARVDNAASADEEEAAVYERRAKSGAELRQLLGRRSRSDTVAAR